MQWPRLIQKDGPMWSLKLRSYCFSMGECEGAVFCSTPNLPGDDIYPHADDIKVTKHILLIFGSSVWFRVSWLTWPRVGFSLFAAPSLTLLVCFKTSPSLCYNFRASTLICLCITRGSLELIFSLPWIRLPPRFRGGSWKYKDMICHD